MRRPWYRSESRWTLLAVVLMLIAWEIASRQGHVSALYFPSPSFILKTLWRMFESGNLGANTVATLSRVAAAILAGCLPAIALGLVMGWSPRVRRAVDPLIAALHPVPKIAIFPLLMVIFGIGNASKTLVVALAAFFPMLLNVMAGVQQIAPSYYEVVQNYGAKGPGVFRHVVLPGSLPMMLTGARIALNIALVVTIGVELIASNDGLGSVVWRAWQTFRVEELWAGIIVISLLGVAISQTLLWLTRILIPWQQTRGDH